MARLCLSLLGGFNARLDDVPITTIKTDKARALFAYLVMEKDRPLYRQVLAGLFWPDFPEDSARANLRHALANLRQVLADAKNPVPFLVIEGETIQFNPASDYELDVESFRAFIAADPPGQTTIPGLEQAVDLYKGSFLEGFSLKDSPEFDAWALIVREELQRQVLTVLYRLAEAYERRGDLGRAIACARRQLERESCREEAHQQLMRLLAVNGQRVAALAQYDLCRKALAQELSVEPSAETRYLYERILAERIGSPAIERQEDHMAAFLPTTLPGTSLPKHNLPAELTSLVGCEAVLAEIARLLSKPNTRLLTLTGAGGCGKTRLALRTGRDIASGLLRNLAGQYPHGAWLVELAPLKDPELVPQAVIGALGLIVVPGTQPMDVLVSFLATRRLLLILDNCEHLIDAAAALAIDLLRACTELTILATSREPLSVPGEITYRVPSLSLPPKAWDGSPSTFAAASTAAQLFLERAGSVQPGYRLAEGDSPALVAICRRLDGIPLAIELAAARVSVLSLSLIASRLEEGFRVLGHAGRGTVPRHATLRATVEWSYNLLTEPERVLLRHLTFFAGGWRLEQAEEVCPSQGLGQDVVLDLLAGLVNKSLVVVERQPDGSSRYRMHEMVRQYARERLEEAGEGEELQVRFVEYFTCLAEGAEPELKGPRQMEWLARLDQEKDNLTEALRLATAGPHPDPLPALRLSAALPLYWKWRDRQREGLRWIEMALTLMEGREGAAGAQAVRARAMLGSLFLMGGIESAEGIRPRFLECVQLYRLLGERSGLALALCHVNILQDPGAEWAAELRALLLELLETGDHWTASFVLYTLGWWETDWGSYAAGLAYSEQSIQQIRIAGDRIYYAHRMLLFCWLYWNVGELRQGRDCLVEGLHILDEAGIRFTQIQLLCYLSQFEESLGNFSASHACTSKAVQIAEDFAALPGLFHLIYQHAAISNMWDGRLAEARAECEKVRDLHGKIADPETLFVSAMVWHYQGQEAQAVADLQESITLMNKGHYQTTLPRCLRGLGRVRLTQGDLPAARDLFLHSLADLIRFRSLPDFSETLDALACLAVKEGQPEQAARLLGAAEELMARTEFIRYPVFRPEVERCREAAQSKLGDGAYEQVYKEGQQAVRAPDPIEAVKVLVSEW